MMLILNPIVLMMIMMMRRKIIRNHFEDEEDCYDYRAWCDLPEEILSLIMEKLGFMDQAHFRAVCKNWQLVKGIKPSQWLFYSFCNSTNNNTRSKSIQKYHLYNLCTGKTYAIQNKVRHRCSSFSFSISSPTNYVYDWNSTCVAVKSGWLLLIKACCEACYLYNAVTQEAISLPSRKLIKAYSIKNVFNYFDFSLIKKRHFVVYHVDKDINYKNTILISRWRSTGDEKLGWRYKVFKLGEELNLLNVKYVKGTLFCVFSNGTVQAFIDNDLSLSMVVKSENIHIPGKLSQDFMTMSGELVADLEEQELFLVYPSPSNIDWRILRLDWSNKTWVEEMSLGSRVLFCFHKYYAKTHVSMLSAQQDYADDRFKGFICYRNAASPNFDCFPFYKGGCNNNNNNNQLKIQWPLRLPEHLMEAFWFHPPTI